VFNARSSWFDVKTAAPKRTEYVDIITKRGGEWKWKQPAISDASIAFDGTGISKVDVRSVPFVRSKPLTSLRNIRMKRISSWLASLPLVGKVVDGKISVLLYDADQPEDDSPCRMPISGPHFRTLIFALSRFSHKMTPCPEEIEGRGTGTLWS